MLGIGIYLNDVSQQVAKVQTELQSNIRETRLVLFAIAFGALVLTGSIIGAARLSEQRFADARLKELSARQADFQEQERKRVPRELHDSISQLLVSSRYGLESALGKLGDNRAVAEPLEKSMNALSDANSEVRRIPMALRPSVLDELGLAAAVKSLGNDFSKQTGIEVAVKTEQVRDLLSDEAKTALFRVIQEALTNVAKHSGAKHVSVRLSRRGRRVELELEDDGIGLSRGSERQAPGGGLGIRNMQERIDSFDGTIRFSRPRSDGLAIRVSLPIVKPQRQTKNNAT